jgi:hypothetical protein
VSAINNEFLTAGISHNITHVVYCVVEEGRRCSIDLKICLKQVCVHVKYIHEIFIANDNTVFSAVDTTEYFIVLSVVVYVTLVIIVIFSNLVNRNVIGIIECTTERLYSIRNFRVALNLIE